MRLTLKFDKGGKTVLNIVPTIAITALSEASSKTGRRATKAQIHERLRRRKKKLSKPRWEKMEKQSTGL